MLSDSVYDVSRQEHEELTTKTTTAPLLKESQWGRLQPFLRFRSARQRVILYLVAAGYTVGDITRLTRKELFKLPVHIDVSVWRDEMQEENKNSLLAFVFPSGKPLTHTYLYRVIRAAAMKAVGRPMSQEQLRHFVRSTNST